jgi:ferredoxin
MISILRSIWYTFLHAFRRRETILYPEEKPYLPPRYRGRIVLTRDPDGDERCVACYLCAAACPVDCISLNTEDEKGEDILNFSGSTSPAAFSAVYAKRHVPPMPFSSRRILNLVNTTGRIWYMKRSTC